jgi:tetratricopeptide (TPR) repeat protein
MSLGPHINMAAQDGRTIAAHRAALRAKAAAKAATPVERALIEAVLRRSSDPAPASPEAQAALDQGYADAMREVAKRYPEDPDAAALTAEALMNLHPWDLWRKDGAPQPWTGEILALLEGALARNPNHPGANHYYIHAVEASQHPEKALASADRLAGLIPGAAHIVHMPAHIYMRLGRYEDSAAANRKAIATDRAYIEKENPQGFYFMYVAHNFQFLWASAMFEGRYAEALANARKTAEMSPLEMLREMPGFDFTLLYAPWTHLRFGRFDEVLAEKAPPVEFAFAMALWHVARGLALAELGRLEGAEREAAAAAEAGKRIAGDAREGLNAAGDLYAVGSEMLAGVIAARRGAPDEAILHLQLAVAREDDLGYDEPSDWYVPARHALGAILLRAGRATEAQKVYEEDLRRHPENGWALAGLAESLRRQEKAVEAESVAKRLASAWIHADVPAGRSWGAADPPAVTGTSSSPPR